MMSSINSLEWHAGQEGLTLQATSLNNGMLVRSIKTALQVLFYVPAQINRYLDRLDEAPVDYRKQVLHENRQALQSGRHRHIPARVWRRRSALLIQMEAKQSTELHPGLAKHSG